MTLEERKKWKRNNRFWHHSSLHWPAHNPLQELEHMIEFLSEHYIFRMDTVQNKKFITLVNKLNGTEIRLDGEHLIFTQGPYCIINLKKGGLLGIMNLNVQFDFAFELLTKRIHS